MLSWQSIQSSKSRTGLTDLRASRQPRCRLDVIVPCVVKHPFAKLDFLEPPAGQSNGKCNLERGSNLIQTAVSLLEAISSPSPLLFRMTLQIPLSSMLLHKSLTMFNAEELLEVMSWRRHTQHVCNEPLLVNDTNASWQNTFVEPCGR